MTPNNQWPSGMILIVVLLITAVLAGLATQLIIDDHNNITRAHIILSESQAIAELRGTQVWAKNILSQDIYASSQELLAWPKVMPPVAQNNSIIQADLCDAQSFYNINNFAFDHYAGLIHLIASLSPETKPQSLVFPSERLTFLTLNEIVQLNYVTPSLFNLLSPFMIALPQQTLLNINTASAETLTTLGNGLSLAQAAQLVEVRQTLGGFATLDSFFNQPLVYQLHISASQVTAQSIYFLLKTDIQHQKQHYQFFTLFQRQVQNGKVTAVILWERQDYL